MYIIFLHVCVFVCVCKAQNTIGVAGGEPKLAKWSSPNEVLPNEVSSNEVRQMKFHQKNKVSPNKIFCQK